MREQSPSQQVFNQTLWNAIGNTAWFAAAAFVIVLTASIWMKLAIVLAALFLIVIAVDVVWVIWTVIIPGVRSGPPKDKWLFLATMARLLDVVAGVALGCYLYWIIF